jgi:predicted NAD/FAD-binding protein
MQQPVEAPVIRSGGRCEVHGMSHPRSRVAIVGAGVSGLTVAHLLHPRHDVTVFEAGAYAGGHTNTVRVDLPDETLNVDTGFIVFNDRNYPNFQRLLDKLGVESQRSTMSFSVSAVDEDFEYAGTPRGLLAQPGNLTRPAFVRMIGEYMRFNRDALALMESGDDTTSLGDWLAELRYSEGFIRRLIVPQASAVWSADPDQMWSFPARFLVTFFHNHGMLSLKGRPTWRTIKGGSARYVEALTAPFAERIRLRTPVERIERFDDHVLVTPRGGEPERYDEVVLATHADRSLAMLADATDREHQILEAIPYQPNEAVLHTDRTLLPRRRAAWSSWNYHLLDRPTGSSTVTYHMNTLQRLRSSHELCVTLNRTEAIDPARIIATIPYAHPVFTPEGWAAQRRHDEISGVGRTHFCGAYWRWGFHEDGVVSALRVAERFGAVLA